MVIALIIGYTASAYALEDATTEIGYEYLQHKQAELMEEHTAGKMN